MLQLENFGLLNRIHTKVYEVFHNFHAILRCKTLSDLQESKTTLKFHIGMRLSLFLIVFYEFNPTITKNPSDAWPRNTIFIECFTYYTCLSNEHTVDSDCGQ